MVQGIIDTRASGKTKKLIETAAQTGAIIVCESVPRMVEKIHGYGKVGIPVISVEEFLATWDPAKSYCIDELEAFCTALNITAFTWVK